MFYPVASATVPGTEDVALESLEEHHIVKWVLSELDGMDPAEERFDAKVTVLIENVRHHVEEEEHEFFPKVRAELDRKALAEVGGRWRPRRSWRRVTPTALARHTSREPGCGCRRGNGGPHQRHGEWCRPGQRDAVQDLVALILGRPKRSAAPTGSKAARGTAQDVRGGASKLTDDAIAAGGSGQSDGVDGCNRREEDRADRGRCHQGHRPGRQEEREADRIDGASLGKRTASTAKRSSATRPPNARSRAKKAASTTRRTAKKATSTTS